jgi:hypothetical protein
LPTPSTPSLQKSSIKKLNYFTLTFVQTLNFCSRLLNNQFVARVVSREPYLSIILYESPSELNINEWILDQVAEKVPAIPLKVFEMSIYFRLECIPNLKFF